jgi:hypothetical protein
MIINCEKVRIWKEKMVSGNKINSTRTRTVSEKPTAHLDSPWFVFSPKL